MSVQRERVASLKKDLKNALKDGESAARVARLRGLLAAETAQLLRSREPGTNCTVAELETDKDSEDDK